MTCALTLPASLALAGYCTVIWWRICPDEAPSAARIIELVEQAVRRARDLARGLQPLQLKPDALGAALSELAANIQSTFGIHCVCRLGDAPIILQDTAAAIQLYHIAQEAINNAIRHGKAAQILVELIRVGNSIVLSVEDNGVGIGTNPVAGLGFQTMRHRARAWWGGRLRSSRSRGQRHVCSMQTPGGADPTRRNSNPWHPMIERLQKESPKLKRHGSSSWTIMWSCDRALPR